jgi:membrane protease YdiL (CAAX protease family)
MKRAVFDTLLYIALALVCALAGSTMVWTFVSVAGITETPETWVEANPLAPMVAMWALLVPATIAFARTRGLDRAGLGLRRRRPGPELALGLAFGVTMIAIPAGLGRLLGGYVPATVDTPSGAAALPLLGGVVPALLLAAFGEEVAFRGFVQPLWQRVGGVRAGLLVSSLLFTIVHASNPGLAPAGIAGILLAGVWLGLARLLSGSLWLPAGLHAGWNIATSTVFGLPVSGFEQPALLRWAPTDGTWARGLLGGGFGPEEGLAFHGSLVLGIVAMLVLAPLLREPDAPGD